MSGMNETPKLAAPGNYGYGPSITKSRKELCGMYAEDALHHILREMRRLAYSPDQASARAEVDALVADFMYVVIEHAPNYTDQLEEIAEAYERVIRG